MTSSEREKVIKVLKVLLAINDFEIVKYTLESLVEELEDNQKKIKK